VRRAIAVAAFLLLAASGCGGSARGGSGLVTADGQVGSLQIDLSKAANIVAFAGKPDIVTTGKTSWPGVPRYRALAYGCPHGMSLPRVDSCQTVYYVNVRTRRLTAFETRSPAFHTWGGVRPGMDQNTADRIVHETPQGPWNAIGEGGAANADDLIMPSTCRRVVSGRCRGKVQAFMLESRTNPIGLLFT